VVVTLPSLEGRTRDEVALEIGRQWGVGRRGDPGDPARNTGIVVLVVPKETAPDGRGQLKIETGTGTTRFITAAEAGRVADAYMIPYFREGDYGMGIYAGVMALAAMYAEEFGFELTGEVPAPRGRGQEGSPIMAFVLAAFVIYMILRAFTGGPRGG